MTLFAGTRIIARWTVTDETTDPPALADPTTMAVLFGRVGGTQNPPTQLDYPADIEIVRDSVGTFHLEIDCPDPGEWVVDVYPNSGIVGAAEKRWSITKTAFVAV